MRLGAVRRLRWKRIGTASFRTVVGGIFRASVQFVVGLGRLVFRVGRDGRMEICGLDLEGS